MTPSLDMYGFGLSLRPLVRSCVPRRRVGANCLKSCIESPKFESLGYLVGGVWHEVGALAAAETAGM